MTRFFLNHIGLERGRAARALLHLTDAVDSEVELITAAGWTKVGTIPRGRKSVGFRGMRFAELDLAAVPDGRYILRLGEESSAPFWIGTDLLERTTTDSVLTYFKSQRCAGPWNEKDRALPFFGGREGTVDVSGGWYDAAGDVSKYLSHLSYSNFHNPQQTPIVVWALLEYLERKQELDPGTRERVLDEARHGAEFLSRMQDPAGYFYITVFDQWSKFTSRRFVCSYKTQKGELLSTFEAGYRQGGGATIAALARAGRLLDEPRFLDAARRGHAHLEANNTKYLDDGKENIIDDYCALLAAVELFASTADPSYEEAATTRAVALGARLRDDGPHPGWFVADDGERPFYHAAEAGLPVLSLLRFAEVCPRRSREWIATAEKALRFELEVTKAVDNPHGYARQFTVDLDGVRKTSFFIPHKNETGYWWQGENARLASLAAAAGRLAFVTNDPQFRDDLHKYAFAQLDWICGNNPFDSCMLHGYGRNNKNYMDLWPNAVGGILNGITSRFEDENDADFGRTDVEGDHSWRWFEQWLPHASWYLVALAELSSRAK